MPLPWIKMWLEALDDPKLTRLSLAEQGAWWGVIELAAKCDAKGKLVSGGQPLTIAEIAEALHIKTAGDRKALESMIAKMEQRNSLAWNEGHTLTVVNWEKRQARAPSARPEAVAERVRRFRARTQAGKKIHKLCPFCGWKGLTSEEYCPQCAKKGKDSPLEKDYKGGKYGHMVRG